MAEIKICVMNLKYFFLSFPTSMFSFTTNCIKKQSEVSEKTCVLWLYQCISELPFLNLPRPLFQKMLVLK